MQVPPFAVHVQLWVSVAVVSMTLPSVVRPSNQARLTMSLAAEGARRRGDLARLIVFMFENSLSRAVSRRLSVLFFMYWRTA